MPQGRRETPTHSQNFHSPYRICCTYYDTFLRVNSPSFPACLFFCSLPEKSPPNGPKMRMETEHKKTVLILLSNMQRFPFGKKREDCYCCIMTPEEEDLLSVVLHFPNGRARMNCSSSSSSSSCANREVNRVFSVCRRAWNDKKPLLIIFPNSPPPTYCTSAWH